MNFPAHRLSRLRRTAAIRGLVRKSQLTPSDFVCPIFVRETFDPAVCEQKLPGVCFLDRHHGESGDLIAEVRRIHKLGIPAVLVFGIPATDEKDQEATFAHADDGPVQKAVRLIKSQCPEIAIITDVCLCEYKPDGHCLFFGDNGIETGKTLERIKRIAKSHATAGADIVAPAGMVDGMVQAIRSELDDSGHKHVMIMPYSAKFASQLYSPFKSVTESTTHGESRHTMHQLDFASDNQPIMEIRMDIEEGADIVLVKPAITSLDIIYRAKQNFDIPIAAYNVSGTYEMIRRLANGSPETELKLAIEFLTCIKRAGADIIITYFAQRVCRKLTGL